MPRYVIEREFLVPVYEHILVEAPDLHGACRLALDEHEQPWGDDAQFAYDDARPVVIAEAVELPEAMCQELRAGDDLDRDTLSRLLYHSGLGPLPIPAEFAKPNADSGENVGFT